jgi:Zn-dependent protease with chaperone function
MRRIATSCLAIALAISGCGTSYQMPAIDAATAERERVRQQEAAKSGPPTKVERSQAEAGEMVRRVQRNLEASAVPMCSQLQLNVCTFDVDIKWSERTPNAFAFENNKIGITAGMLNLIENDDQLALVIGHEMGHHWADHLTKMKTNVTVGAVIGAILLGGLAAAAGGNATTVNQATAAGIGLGAAGGKLSFSKSHELEADYLGAYAAARASYDVRAGADLWRRMSQNKPGTEQPQLFATHPPSAERFVALENTAMEIDAKRKSEAPLLPQKK